MPEVTLPTCPYCGNTFQPQRSNQRFCSQKCKWTYTNRTRMLKPNVHGVCIVCGNPFERYVEPSKIVAGLATAEYCGLKCKGRALSGENHPMWKGGRCVVNGYVWIHCPNHPHAKHQGYVLEHRLVMEKVLGRYLTLEEVVHHRDDRDTTNNDPSNLYLYACNADHKRDDIVFRDRDAAGRLLPKARPQ